MPMYFCRLFELSVKKLTTTLGERWINVSHKKSLLITAHIQLLPEVKARYRINPYSANVENMVSS
jgi:hypothetical protein